MSFWCQGYWIYVELVTSTATGAWSIFWCNNWRGKLLSETFNLNAMEYCQCRRRNVIFSLKKETVVKLVLRFYGALPKNSYSGSLPDNPCCWRYRCHAFICLVSDIMFQFPTLEDLHLAKYIFSHNSYWLLTQEGEVVPRSAVQRTSAAAAFIKPLPQTDRLHIQNIPQLPNMFWL